MNNYLDKIIKDLTKDNLQSYWFEFEAVAYAIYDKQNVYVFNHPNVPKEEPYQTLRWDEQFMGCTVILYDNYPTAIVDSNLHNDYESIYSNLIHELFHGLQHLKGENRFPDETLGMTYPLLLENIELRSQERLSLYHAVVSEHSACRNEYMTNFISLREKRKKVLKEHLNYENLLETVEGPAWYVELKAYTEKSPHSSEHAVKKFALNLMDGLDSTRNIRKSCYSSGLSICLLLDELSPNWKRTFLESDVTLYDLFKQEFTNLENDFPEETMISQETKSIYNDVYESKANVFENFNNEPGVQIVIEGDIRVKSFDPMNVISLGEKRLYQTFLKVDIHNEHFLIQQPVVAYFASDKKSIHTLQLNIDSPPIEKSNSLVIKGIGEVCGAITQEENRIRVKVT